MRAAILALAVALAAGLAAPASTQGFDVSTTFKRWDANGDGVITPEELAAAIAKLQQPKGN